MKDKNKIIDDLKRLRNEEKFKEAIQICEELLDINEKDEQLNDLYIDILFRYGYYLNDEYIEEYEKSIKIFEKIILLDPDNYKAIYNKGIALFNLGKFQTALECYNKVIKLKPDYKHVYYNIGLLYEKDANFEKALKFYKKALKIDPLFVYASVAESSLREELKMMNLNNPESKIDFNKLKALLKASKKVKIRMIQKYLNIDKDDLDDILDWCEKYGFQIDGEFLEINKNRLQELLEDIDNGLL
ncbi:MAG: tetratricopeptide repeat protein [Promethearchaeota archaeon]